MHTGLQIQAPFVVARVFHAADRDTHVSQHGVASVIASVAHQLGHVARAVLEDPFSDAGKILILRAIVAALVTAVLKWSTRPKAIPIDTQSLMPGFAKRQKSKLSMTNGIRRAKDIT